MTLTKLVKGCALAAGLCVLMTPAMAHYHGYEQSRFHSDYYGYRHHHHHHHFSHMFYGHHHHHHHHHGMRHLYPYPHPHPTLWRDPARCMDFHGTTFNYPMSGNYRVDFCYKSDRFCGRAAANAFCRMNGYNFAGLFFIQRDVGATIGLGDHKVMGSRDGFRSITCRN